MLDKIKAGDEVSLYDHRTLIGIRKVARVTKSMIVLHLNTRYYKKNGKSWGGGSYHIQLTTDSDRQEVARREDARKTLEKKLF